MPKLNREIFSMSELVEDFLNIELMDGSYTIYDHDFTCTEPEPYPYTYVEETNDKILFVYENARMWYKNIKELIDDELTYEYFPRLKSIQPANGKYIDDGVTPFTNFQCIRYFKNGKLHRINGPSQIVNGEEMWMYEGLLHRLNGPAIYNKNKSMFTSYHIKGKLYMAEEYFKELEKYLTKEEIFLIKLKYC